MARLRDDTDNRVPRRCRHRHWIEGPGGERLPVDPRSIGWVVLTQGHIDRTGYLPRFIKDGFSGRVFAAWATVDLLKAWLVNNPMTWMEVVP